MVEDPIQSASSGARSNSPVPSFHSSTELPSRSAVKAPQILSMNDPRLVSKQLSQSIKILVFRNLKNSLYDIPTQPVHHSSSSSISSVPVIQAHSTKVEKLPTRHDWVIKTFPQPTQCMQCATYMIGVFRQGITCQTCHYNAHYLCTKFVPGVCPLPEMDKQKRVGLNSVNIQSGTGTAYESIVSLPKPKVRIGWHIQRLFDNKLRNIIHKIHPYFSMIS